jgi:cyanophycinase-like exopeptidase
MRHIFAILGKNHNVSVGCTSAGALVLRTEMGRVGGMYQRGSGAVGCTSAGALVLRTEMGAAVGCTSTGALVLRTGMGVSPS